MLRQLQASLNLMTNVSNPANNTMELIGFLVFSISIISVIILLLLAWRNRQIGWFFIAVSIGILPSFESVVRVLIEVNNHTTSSLLFPLFTLAEQATALLGILLLYSNNKKERS